MVRLSRFSIYLSAIWVLFLIQAWIWQHMCQRQSNLQTITFETSEGSENTWLQNQLFKSAVISLVTSRFDYCNGLLCGIPEELICKLQRVQNNAARVITLTKKHNHITPVLKELHWLPVRKRIEFKILLSTGVQVFAWNCTFLSEGIAERVCPTTDTEINIQELTLRAEKQHENLRWQIV